MRSEYKPEPNLLWNRVLIMLFFITGAYIGHKILALPFIDPSFMFCAVLVALLIGWKIFFKTLRSPFLSVLVALNFFALLIINSALSYILKLHIIAFGFVMLAGLVALFKHFNYLWSFKTVRFLAVFAVLNIIYFFFHSSDFNISHQGQMYGWNTVSAEQDAKFIVLLDGISTFLSFCVPAAIFSQINSKEELDRFINKLGYVFLAGFLLLLIPMFLVELPAGSHMFLPLNFFFLFSLKLYFDNNFNKGSWFNFAFFSILIGLIFVSIIHSNKSAFASFIATLAFFVFVNFKYIRYKIKVLPFEKIKILLPLLLFVFVIIIAVLVEKLEVIDLVEKKYSEIMSSFSSPGITSWYIRTNNWYYFLLDWKNNLNIFNVIFGFGLGASRETIFYISAMQYSDIYLVQTVHNQFLEMFYDYGLAALLFYLPLIGITVKDFFTVLSKDADKNVKLFCVTNLTMIMYLVLYHIADGLRVETTVMFFSFLAFSEMAKQRIISFVK